MAAALKAAQAWGAGVGQPFLVFIGPRGVGKTHLALAGAAGCIARRVRVTYEIVPRFLDELRATQAPGAERSLEEVLRRAAVMPALILDELGADTGTDWAQKQVRSLVNERWRRELPTLVTSNVDQESLDGDTRSRLFDRRLSWVVPCEGRDVRMEG